MMRVARTYDKRSGPEVRGPLPNVALAAKTELLDQRAIAVDVFPSQVVEQSAAAPHEEQEAATAVMVVLVLAEVLGEVTDAPREHRDLNLGRAGVGLALA